MSTSNRAAKLTKTHKVLKKHYKPSPVAERPVLEHLLYACCLEFAPFEVADEAFARMQQTYFDWNEVRVTTVSELAEVMAPMTRAAEAASRLKRTLQSVFESCYSFDLEALRKENIGKAVKQLERLDGISPFALAFVTQNALGGHAIPVSDDALEALRVMGIVSDGEAQQRRVPGLERAIPKNRGVEFGSLLHQLGTDYGAAPFSLRLRAVMLEIAPDAKDRFPKRGSKRKSEESLPEDASAEECPAETCEEGDMDLPEPIPAEPPPAKPAAKKAPTTKKTPRTPKQGTPKQGTPKQETPKQETPKQETTGEKFTRKKPR
jgi:endonuclease III